MKYTKKQIQFLRTNCARMPVPKLAQKFNARFKQKKTASAIAGVIRRHKLREGVRSISMSGLPPGGPSARAFQYANDVLAGRIPVGKYVRLACERFARDIENTKFPYRYDVALADKKVGFMEKMRHVKGPKTGQRLILEPWQCFIECNLFGWIHKDTGLRRFRSSYEEIPRKNGKSVRVAARGMVIFCIESRDDQGMECISGAGSEKQAWHVFYNVKEWAKRSEALRNRFGIEENAKNLVIAETGSVFEPVIGNPGDGGSYGYGVVDEYHEHDSDRLYDCIQTGQGARLQPLLSAITTAGTNLSGPCYEHRSDVVRILERQVRDETLFGIIYSIDAEDDWNSIESLKKANPNYGVSVSAEYLKQQLAQARRSATKQNSFRTKNLNEWLGATVAWLNMLAWQRQQKKDIEYESLQGHRAWLGIDLASKKDVAAISVLVQMPGGGYHTFQRFFAPEGAREVNDKYQQYETGGHMVITPGNATDYGAIEDEARELCKFLNVQNVGFDQWQAQYMAQNLQQAGLAMTEFPHQVRTMSDPMKEIEAMVLDRKLTHDGNPAMTWMVGNVTARLDKKDNIYPNKARPNDERCKIDGLVALIMAVGLMLRTKETGSMDDYLSDPVATL